MKLYLLLLILPFTIQSQTGPGGVGLNDGTSSLKIWYRTDNGVITGGAQINQIVNSAGIPGLDISEAGTQRPTLLGGAVNGYDEISFNGNNRLRTGFNLTTTNFITNEASTFLVCRADNTTQTSSVYTTDPLVGSTRFTCHIPWSNTVYYDIGTCCGVDARIQVGGLAGLTNYSYWSYDANPLTGKQLYRNGALLQSRANTTNYTSHATQRFNLGANTGGSNGFVGDITEVIVFRTKINTTQRIIIENYLSAKYNIPSAQNDLYTMDNAGNGNYDHDVAGIGRISGTDLHNDSRGTGIVRILNPSHLDNNEFLIWGHDNGVPEAINFMDVSFPVVARFDRVWRVSEVNTSNNPIDVGTIDIRFDLSNLGPITASDLRLLVDSNNNGVFSDDTPIAGAVNLGGNIYAFTGISAIQNSLRFTLGTIDFQTPLPISLLEFNAAITEGRIVQLDWATASETNNSHFEIERKNNSTNWEKILSTPGAGNSSIKNEYLVFDNNPFSGISYYRLKQIDFNGNFSYSNIKSISFSSTEKNNIHIYPNPTNDFVILEDREVDINLIKILNGIGQEVTSKCRIHQISDTEVMIEMEELPRGLYLLKTTHSSGMVYKE